MHASVGWVCESIRPGKTILPPRSIDLGVRPALLEDLGIGPDLDQPVALDGQGLANREPAIDGDDLAVVEDQVGFLGRDLLDAQTRSRGPELPGSTERGRRGLIMGLMVLIGEFPGEDNRRRPARAVPVM